MKMLFSVLLIALIGILSSFDSNGNDNGDGVAQGYKPGDKAMSFSLKNIDGRQFDLTDMEDNKGVILVFTCNHCPFSIAYEDRIIALNEKYKGKGFPVIAVNPNDPIAYPADSYENMQERAAEKGFTFPYLVDENQLIANTYGATKTPHVFVMSRKGNEYVVEYIGAIDDNSNEPEMVKNKYVEMALTELLAGKRVSTNFTKAIGCGIKWKK